MTIWYIARGAGLAALLLLTATTVIGALITGRRAPANHVVVQYLHRVSAALGLGVLILHITTILGDSYAGVGWRGAIVPFTSGYRPTWVGLGTLAAYCFVAAAALGIARGRFAASPRGAMAWRWLHGIAYLGWGLAVLHGLNVGSDSGLSWVRWLYICCVAAVSGAVVIRLGFAKRPDLVRNAAVPR